MQRMADEGRHLRLRDGWSIKTIVARLRRTVRIIGAISIYEWIRREPTQRVTHCRGLLPEKLLARFAVNHDKLDTHFERLSLPTPTPQRGHDVVDRTTRSCIRIVFIHDRSPLPAVSSHRPND